jgi:uncharacterized protein YwgA
MSSSILLPLALLYGDGQRQVEGATRFQKLAFLTQEEASLSSRFEFRADKYGPFSPQLHGTLEELENRGLIKKDIQTNRSGNEKYVYHLTDAGRRVVQKLKKRDDSGAFDTILKKAHETKRKHNQKPLDRLLKYVYSKYPSYTENSELDEFKP